HTLGRRAFADDFRVLALLLAFAVALTLARFGELGLVALDLVQVEIFVLDLDRGDLGLLGRIRFLGFFLALFGFAFLAFLFFARLAFGFGLRALGFLPRALFLLAPAPLLVRLAARLFLLALAALVLLPVGFRLRLAVGFFLRLALFFLALRKRIQVREQGVDRGAFRGGRGRLRCGRHDRLRFGRRHSCFDLLARAFLSFALQALVVVTLAGVALGILARAALALLLRSALGVLLRLAFGVELLAKVVGFAPRLFLGLAARLVRARALRVRDTVRLFLRLA